jgi:uncharacterized protein YoxC
MNSDEIPPRDKALLDLVLDGKSDRFKVKVFEIVRKLKLDATDPSFLLLLSTGQLQVLLEEFPAEFETLFTNLLAKMQQQYKQIEDSLRSDIKMLRGEIQGIQASNEELLNNLNAVVDNLKQFSADQKELVIQQVRDILASANVKRTELAAEVKRVEEKEREKRMEAYRSALQKNATNIIEQAGEALKAKHTQEMVLPLVVGALIFAALGGLVGYVIGRNQASSYPYGRATPTGEAQVATRSIHRP